MTHLYDILDEGELAAAIAAKHVREQVHQSEPLAILNYSEACVYENGWNPTTLLCRGLIYNTATGEVVARPFAKFFNYGQPGAAVIGLEEVVCVMDKIDGSLGILYAEPSTGQPAIATRGSFTSDQAVHATSVLRERYMDWFRQAPGQDTTALFEIVYPENRIVLDYGSQDDLVLLGGVDVESGWPIAPRPIRDATDWPGPLAETFDFPNFAAALAAPPRPNAEGFVIRHVHSGRTVKLKQEDYIALHKIVTGLSARTVWQHLKDGKPIKDLIEPLPDEFHTWVLEVAHDLTRMIVARDSALRLAYSDILADLPYERFSMDDQRAAKKEFAMVAKDSPDPWAMFALYDDKDISAKLWDEAKPEAFVTPSGRTYTEDVA